MLRAIVKSCGMGGKEAEINGLNLIDKLQEINAFGTMSSILAGGHEFEYNGPFKPCKFCGVGIGDHE